MSSASVEQAVRLVRQAVLQDSKRNYPEAARCYREAILAFKEVTGQNNSSRRLQDVLATKLGEGQTDDVREYSSGNFSGPRSKQCSKTNKLFLKRVFRIQIEHVERIESLKIPNL